MKKSTMDKIETILKDLDNQREVILSDDIMERAKLPLERMLELAK